MRELLPKSPYAQIGSIIHTLIAESSAGALINFDQFEARWNTLIEQSEFVLMKSSLTRHLVPLSKSVSNLSKKKFQCWDTIQEIKSSITHRSSSPVDQGFGQALLSEHWVQTQDGLIGGYIDAIVKGSRGPIIIEYKSGNIFSLASDQHGEHQVIRTDYLTQVSLYAALFNENRGIWPSEILITSISGDVVDVKFDKTTCLSLVDEVKKDIAATNSIIRQYYNNSQFLLSQLTKPSIEACRFCQYRPACDHYWAARMSDPCCDWPKDVKGIVQEISVLDNGMQLLHLANRNLDNHLISIRGLDPSRYDLSGIEGQEIAIYNLYSDPGENNYRGGMLTTIYEI